MDTATARTVLKTTISKYCAPLKPLKEQFPLEITMYSSSPYLHADRNSGEVSSSKKNISGEDENEEEKEKEEEEEEEKKMMKEKDKPRRRRSK